MCVCVCVSRSEAQAAELEATRASHPLMPFYDNAALAEVDLFRREYTKIRNKKEGPE